LSVERPVHLAFKLWNFSRKKLKIGSVFKPSTALKMAGLAEALGLIATQIGLFFG
jgi:hypothetical protein